MAGQRPGLLHAVLLDEICAHPADPGVSPDVVAALADRDELRVPATVTRTAGRRTDRPAKREAEMPDIGHRLILIVAASASVKDTGRRRS